MKKLWKALQNSRVRNLEIEGCTSVDIEPFLRIPSLSSTELQGTMFQLKFSLTSAQQFSPVIGFLNKNKYAYDFLKWERNDTGFHLVRLAPSSRHRQVDTTERVLELMELLRSTAPELTHLILGMELMARAYKQVFSLPNLQSVGIEISLLNRAIPALRSATSLRTLCILALEPCSEELAKALGQSSITELSFLNPTRHRAEHLHHLLISSRLKVLEIEGLAFDKEKGSKFCYNLLSCPSLTSLRFSNCEIDLAPLIQILPRLSLVDFRFRFSDSSEDWDDAHLADLIKIVSRTKLRSLALSNFSWSYDDMKSFAVALPSMTLLDRLELSCDCISFDVDANQTLNPLFAAVSKSSIRDLILEYNRHIDPLDANCSRWLLKSQVAILRLPGLMRLPDSSSRHCLQFHTRYFRNEDEEDFEEEEEEEGETVELE
jgi:hypothetical protein